jgi:hypothetical protein
MSTLGKIFSDNGRSEITSRSESTGFLQDHASSVTSINAATSQSQHAWPSKDLKSFGRSVLQRQVRIDENTAENADEDLVSDLRRLIARLKNSRTPSVLRFARKELKAAVQDVEQLLEEQGDGLRSPLAGSTLAPSEFELGHSERTLTYTPLLDEYLEKQGDLDLARERYETFIRELDEDKERQERFGHVLASKVEKRNPPQREEDEEDARKLVENLQAAFSDVKIWEQACIDQSLLSQARDSLETFNLVMDISGRTEKRSFLKPSSNWHERLAAGEFEVRDEPAVDLPIPPVPPPPSQVLALSPNLSAQVCIASTQFF